MKLTQATIATIKLRPDQSERIVFDERLPGFGLRLRAVGKRVVREPLDWLLQTERREMVRAALELLPRRDAEILLLKYTENWSYRELAAHLGVSESAIETRLHRARERLRAALADTCEPEMTT